MNKYESVIIINPNVDEEGIKGLVQKFTDLINNDGKGRKSQDSVSDILPIRCFIVTLCHEGSNLERKRLSQE